MAIFRRDKKGKVIKVSQDNDPFYITGRKPIVDEIVVAKLEQAFSIGCPTLEACAFAGISRDCFYDFVKKYPEFSDRFNDLKHKPILEARDTVVRSIKTNPEMAFRYLERKRPKEFGNNLKLTDGEGKPLKTVGDVVNNNLTMILENADTNTRKNFIELSRKLLAGGNKGGDIPLQPSSSN